MDKFSPSTGEVCDPLRKLTSIKTEWTWNNTYQKLYEQAKFIIKIDSSIKFYNEKEELYLQIDV